MRANAIVKRFDAGGVSAAAVNKRDDSPVGKRQEQEPKKPKRKPAIASV